MTTRSMPRRSVRSVAIITAVAVLIGWPVPAVATTTMTPLQNLGVTNAEGDDWLGCDVAVYGDTAVVGAKGDDSLGIVDAGSARVFVRNGGTWTESVELRRLSEAAYDGFGESVDIDGDIVVAGAAEADTARGADAGAVQAFMRAGFWNHIGDLSASDGEPNAEFGRSVAVSGNTLLVGAPKSGASRGEANRGSAYLFTRTTGAFTEAQEIWSSDGLAGDLFGWDVEIDGDTLFVSAPSAAVGGRTGAGAVYVFTRTGGTGPWSQQAKIVASDPAANVGFGYSLAYSNGTLIVGAPDGMAGPPTTPGAAYVFTGSGGTWAQQAKLTPTAGTILFGSSMAVSGDFAVVGAMGDETWKGCAHWFTRTGSVWSTMGKVVPADLAGGDRFGIGVAIDSAGVLLGAPGDDTAAGANAGSLYVLPRNVPTSITMTTNATSATGRSVPMLSGVITPTEFLGKNIMVMVKRPGRSYYSYSSWRTAYSWYGVTKWMYKYYFKPTMPKGVYYFYSIAPNWPGYSQSRSAQTVAIRLR